MLELGFAGWFQCRLATDPDPADERRGVSGWSFAVGTEADLDRVIRFRDPVDARTPGPTVGVVVREVWAGGERRPDHPLLGAPVDLLDSPRFEGRNGLIAEDGLEPIHPFHVRVSGGGLLLRREDVLDPEDKPLHLVEPKRWARRAGKGLEMGPVVEREVGAAAGIRDAPTYLRERQAALAERWRQATEPSERAALETRLWAATDPDTRRKRLLSMGGRVSYAFDVGQHGRPGEAEAEGGADFGGVPDTDAPWPVAFWLGAWDADALCGFARGRLTVPLRARRRP